MMDDQADDDMRLYREECMQLMLDALTSRKRLAGNARITAGKKLYDFVFDNGALKLQIEKEIRRQMETLANS